MKNFIPALLFFFSGFASHSQTACDSLEIEVIYSPFIDSLIEVNVINNSSEIFSNPGFIILDINGDTIAKEDVIFFGIGPVSRHVLNIFPGSISSSTFVGELQLWSGFYSTLECTYNMTFNLCPDSCWMIYPYIINLGGGISIGTVDWTLQDSASTIIASGSLTLDNNIQEDKDSVCVSPGNYTLHFADNPIPMMGQPFVGVSGNIYSPDAVTFYSGNLEIISFNLFENCAITTSVTNLHPDDEISMYNSNGILKFSHINPKDVWFISVFSSNGQLVWKGKADSYRDSINLTHLNNGIYLVEAQNGKKSKTVKIYF